MEDLSNHPAVVNSIWPVSQHSGNRPSDQGAAMTAPGSPSPSVDEADVSGQPFVVPSDHQRTVMHPEGSPSPSPWTRADGTPWRDATPDINGGSARPGPWGQS